MTITAPPLGGQVIGSANNDFVLAEWRDAGGHAGERFLIAPPHVHRHDDEAWYVLEGTLCVQVGEQEVEARAGSAVFVTRGTPHCYWNPDAQPARYLLVMTSRIFRLIEEIHATRDRSPASMQALFRKYDSELLG